MNLLKTLAVVLLIILNSYQTVAQNTNDTHAYYLAFDSIVGQENTALYNGKRYIEKYRATSENHLFYKDVDFLKGALVYSDQPFYNQYLKYDLLNDVLIVKPSGDKSYFNIELISEFLQEFTIENTLFVNLSQISSQQKGFAELVYKGNAFLLLRKLEKKIKERIKNEKLFYEFIESYHFLVAYQNKVEVIDSKRSLKKFIPEKASEIDAFYRSNKTLLKVNPDLFMERLIIALDENLTANTQ